MMDVAKEDFAHVVIVVALKEDVVVNLVVIMDFVLVLIKNILLDVRFLNTIQEALDIPSGLYVSTLYNPFDCCGCIPQNIAYKKCGEKFALDNKLCAFGNLELGILNLENKTPVGNAIQYKSFCSDVQSYDLDFPKDALPLEKLLIISEIFMFVFLKWDGFLNRNDMIITKKRKTLPGLNPDFI